VPTNYALLLALLDLGTIQYANPYTSKRGVGKERCYADHMMRSHLHRPIILCLRTLPGRPGWLTVRWPLAKQRDPGGGEATGTLLLPSSWLSLRNTMFTLAEEPLEVTTEFSAPGLIDLLLKARLGGEEAKSVRVLCTVLPGTRTQAAGVSKPPRGSDEAMSMLLLCVRLQTAPFASAVVHCNVILGLCPRLGGRGLIPPWSLHAGALLAASICIPALGV